ncbi:MAG: hypothetical protein ABJA37_07505 [Ferruginibacter sp.]
MRNKLIFFSGLIILLIMPACFISCSKTESTPNPSVPPPPPPPDVCIGKTITITATTTASASCVADGKITVAAAGSTGFTYKLNSGGTYQASAAFSNLSAGTYTVFVKDVDGCEKSTPATVTSGGAPGALFSNLKNLMAAKCQSCHNNTIQNGGMNWALDCNIVANQARIKVRAVDQGTMPPTGPLSQAEKDIITNWITAGGKFTD